MTTTGWVTFAVVTTFIWGGFLLLLLVALRKDASRRTSDES
jgi:hypothetical protein